MSITADIGSHSTIIPAEHGWSVLSPCMDNGRVVSVVYDQVIAWAITEDYYSDEVGQRKNIFVNPITVDGVHPDTQKLYYHRPDGVVYQSDAQLFYNITDVIKSMQIDYDRSIKRK